MSFLQDRTYRATPDGIGLRSDRFIPSSKGNRRLTTIAWLLAVTLALATVVLGTVTYSRGQSYEIVRSSRDHAVLAELDDTPRRTRHAPDDGSQPAEQFWAGLDIDRHTLTFTPKPDAGYDVCVEPAALLPVGVGTATPIRLENDDFAEILLNNGTIPFYGFRYASIHVGSNGYVTFGSGDTSFWSDLRAHFQYPRISAYFTDLDPSAGGAVFGEELSDRVVLTWAGVPQFGTTNMNTFQLELFFDGRIRSTYLGIDGALGVVGTSRGAGVPFEFLPTDFAGSLACSASNPREHLIEARRLSLVDPGDHGGHARLSFQSSRSSSFPAPAAGSSEDPSIHGATLEMYNPTTGEYSQYALPANAWRAAIDAESGIAYGYDDREGHFGPCYRGKIKSNGTIAIKCRGEGIDFTLDEAAQESIAVRLTTGGATGNRSYCAMFGGEIRRDHPVTERSRGRFLASNAPPPASCPLP